MLQHYLYPRIVGLPEEPTSCPIFYRKKISMVTSIAKAVRLWTIVENIYPEKSFVVDNIYAALSIQAAIKGIGIGPSIGLELHTPLDGDIFVYLQSYWQASNLLHALNYNQFKNKIEMVRGVVLHAIHYRMDDMVVAENYNKEMSTLKCKIISFFPMHSIAITNCFLRHIALLK